jgi:hypothetical protein
LELRYGWVESGIRRRRVDGAIDAVALAVSALRGLAGMTGERARGEDREKEQAKIDARPHAPLTPLRAEVAPKSASRDAPSSSQ